MEKNIFVGIVYELLKSHIKDCFNINGKQRNIMPKKGEYVKFRNFERKIKSSFITFEINLKF